MKPKRVRKNGQAWPNNIGPWLEKLPAEQRAQLPMALQHNIRCVTLFDQFPSPLTGTGPTALARLTRQLGMPALEQTWQQVTGQPIPQPVRDYITSHPDDDDQPGGMP